MIRSFLTGSTLLALSLTAPAALAQNQAGERDQSTEEMAEDVASQPLRDVGIDEQEIPELLLRVQVAPYSMVGLEGCASIRSQISELDDVLGSDLDLDVERSRGEQRRRTAGRVGGSLLGGLIPFRGIVREVSGAAGRERDYNAAVYAGVVRRSFLKGVGQQRGCRYPGSPARDARTTAIPDTVPVEDED